MSNLHTYRQSYEKGKLIESQVDKNPFVLFSEWFTYAEASKTVREVNAITLSTIGKDGYPKGRVVLLKEYNEEGFIFYTNYTSEKAESIEANNAVSISFFWPDIERQIIIKGQAEKVSKERAKAYFKSRPRGSQLGAWASHQSDEVNSRDILEKRLEKLKLRFEGKEIPKPEFWGGYIVKPTSFEYWQGRPSRLHDRLLYKKNDNNHWSLSRLEP